MSESEPPAAALPASLAPGGDQVEGEGDRPRRPRRRRRSPTRPQSEPVVANAPEEVVSEPRPVFRPLDAEVPPPAVREAGPPERVETAGPEGVDGVRSRRPRRRRAPAKTELVSTVAGDSSEVTGGPETSEERIEEIDEAEAPAPTRGRARRSATGPVAVNVDVPRGLGRRVNAKLIQQVARLAVQREGWSLPASLDVLIVSDDEMREINLTRRGIDEATDVLSFPLLELRPEAVLAEDFFVLPPETQVHLGDVVISFSRVEAQADEAGHSRERELAFLTVHAVLHILGYDHDTEDKRRRMRRREEDVLVELGLRRNGA